MIVIYFLCRTVLWLQYIHNDLNRPPPMNLIPNPGKSIKYMKSKVRDFIAWTVKNPRTKNKSNMKEINKRTVAYINQGYASSQNHISVIKERDSKNTDMPSIKVLY